MVGKVTGESYTPSLPSMFFDFVACPRSILWHAASLSRPLYYVSVVPGMLDGPGESGEQVQSPTPACTPLMTAFQVPHTPQTHCRRGEMVYDEMREGFEVLG